jgi:hypothetical protein
MNNPFEAPDFDTLNKIKDNSLFLSQQYLNPFSYKNVTEYVNSNVIFSSFLMMMLHENGITNADINERFNEVNIYFHELKENGFL